MRGDIRKIFHQSPRSHNHSNTKGKNREENRIGFENLPSREKRETRTGNKGCNFSVLRRYLRSQIGRKWDDVYKDMTSVCDSRNWLDSSLLDQVRGNYGIVEHHAQIIDGEVCDSKGLRIVTTPGYEEFYIHPETKTLEMCEVRNYNKKKKDTKQKVIVLNKLQQYHLIEGVWYLIDFVPYKGGPITNRDVRGPLAKNPTHWWLDLGAHNVGHELKSRYGSNILPVKKTQCGKKALKFIQAELTKNQEKDS